MELNNLKYSCDLSVIIPVSDQYDNVSNLYYDYKTGLESVSLQYEFIYVLDGNFPEVFSELKIIQNDKEPIKIIKLAKSFGEATALSAGFENSSGNIILTLPPFYQANPAELYKVIDSLLDFDMVVVRRWPRKDSVFNRLQTRFFTWIVNFITGGTFQDLGCNIRAFKRKVIDEIPVYGDQHRFLPVLAAHQGFRFKEIDIAQSEKEIYRRIYRPGIYLRRVLDVLTIFFLARFTKKPLRFFGFIGMIIFLLGCIFTIHVVIERLLFNIGLATRPGLLLSSLLVVLGVQIFALGLLGELIIFTHAKNLKEYTIEKIIN